ncbi:hypothetical protein ACKKBG_A28205 [Auxenochlorella protothecoides x Auxenochlorella symbiontica]
MAPKRPASSTRGPNAKKCKKVYVVPLPPSAVDEGDGISDLSDEDLEFVASQGKNLGFLTSLKTKQLDRSVSQTQQKPAAQKKAVPQAQTRPAPADASDSEASEGLPGTDSDSEAEAYERRPRTVSQAPVEQKRAAALPTKSLDGALVRGEVETAPRAADRLWVPGVTIEDDLALEQEAAEEEEGEEDDEAPAVEAPPKRETGKGKRQKDAKAGLGARGARGGRAGPPAPADTPASRLAAAKETLALAAQTFLGSPERHLAQLHEIVALCSAKDPLVARLALVTAAAVLADVVPGYRIRPPTERELEVVVSREVQALRDYEQGLLRQYQRYLRAARAALAAGRAGGAALPHARVAARCMGRLLVAAPHFNYTTDLLQALVPVATSRDPELRRIVVDALRSLLSSQSADGGVVTEAVQLLADLVKARSCVCPPEVVAVLASVHTADITSAKDFQEAKAARKKMKKKERKKDDVDHAFEEARAYEDQDSRQYHQSASLEALFEVYFRVLKHATASGLVARREGLPMSAARFAKKFPLLFPVLEQLAAHAGLIGVEYFGDLMAVLDQLLASSALPAAERVRTLLTASRILSGQGEALNVDRGAFYQHLYRALDAVALQPLEEDGEGEEEGGGRGGMDAGEAPVPSGDAPAAGRLAPLLASLLDGMLLDRRALDASRQAAFAKRLASAAGAVRDPGAALGMLCVLHRLLRRVPRLRAALENEAGGPSGYRTYRPDVEDPAEAGALAVPLWELSLLQRHYHPAVAQLARDLAGGVAQSSVLPPTASPAELAQRYSTATGGFRPAPPLPRKARQQEAGPRKRGGEDEDAVAARLAAAGERAGSRPGDDTEAGLCAAVQGPGPGFGAYFRSVRRFRRHQELMRAERRLGAQLQAFKQHLQAGSGR